MRVQLLARRNPEGLTIRTSPTTEEIQKRIARDMGKMIEATLNRVYGNPPNLTVKSTKIFNCPRTGSTTDGVQLWYEVYIDGSIPRVSDRQIQKAASRLLPDSGFTRDKTNQLLIHTESGWTISLRVYDRVIGRLFSVSYVDNTKPNKTVGDPLRTDSTAPALPAHRVIAPATLSP
jgi:hypothetical protein